MGSRRVATRSVSWNGRSTDVETTSSSSSNSSSSSSSSRSGGCSYLSNVRPENRSTFCSVMAQLMEETQPSFDTTLKSRAVSEKCNVKFSCVVTGYPIPLVTWYKDDMQLDRYCGLPKYEISHMGQNHSLHIYDCTVEDAAIYQASAINSKGIVSCSGVLEVGYMNEFKIHQRYFGKLKQKAESRRREEEGKENQEPLRTISPDRTLRKRRSTMEVFLNTPSSTEDEGGEETPPAVVVETEARLQETASAEVQETPVVNGQVIAENGGTGGTYVCEPAQKMLTAHQPKTPFVKKKIKISSAKIARADAPAEERRAKDEIPASGAPACKDPAQAKRSSEEIMEVEKMIVETSNKKAADKATCRAPSQMKQLVGPRYSAARRPEGPSVSGTEDSHVKKPEIKAGRKDKEAERSKQSPDLNLRATSNVPLTVLGSPKKKNVGTTDATAMDIDKRSGASTGGGTSGRAGLTSPNTSCERSPVSSQRPCDPAGDKSSKKETSPRLKSASQPAPPSEVTYARTETNRNDAPVHLKSPPDQRTQRTQRTQPPQKTSSERETVRDQEPTPSLQGDLKAPIGKMTQGRSRGSDESHKVLSTDLQKSTLENRVGVGGNTSECNVSPVAPQGQNTTAVKSIAIHVNEKVEANDVSELMQTPLCEKVVEMETEPAAPHVPEKSNVDTHVEIVEVSCNKGNESKMEDENSPDIHVIQTNVPASSLPHLANNTETTNVHIPQSHVPEKDFPHSENNTDQTINLNEIPKPVSKVISIAELLRSQIKALDLTLTNAIPVQEPSTPAAETCQGLKNTDGQCEVDLKKPKPERISGTVADDSPPTNIKAMLMELYYQLNKTIEEQLQLQRKTAQVPQKPHVTDSVGIHTCHTNCNEHTQQESSLVPAIDPPVVPKEQSDPSTAKDEQSDIMTSNLSEGVSQESGTFEASSHSDVTVMEQVQAEQVQAEQVQAEQVQAEQVQAEQVQAEQVQAEQVQAEQVQAEQVQAEQVQDKETDSVKAPEIKLNGQSEKSDSESNTGALQSVEMNSAQSETEENNPQLLQTNALGVEDVSRNDIETPQASPRLRKKNCVSPIPSATPQELASGARRKIPVPKTQPVEEEASVAAPPVDNHLSNKELPTQNNNTLSPGPVSPSVSPSLSRRSALTVQPDGERTPPVERRSPLLHRRRMLDAEALSQQANKRMDSPKMTEQVKPPEKDKHDPFKAPQVIRKIRGETFADASGHLKLWCQFFNILSDSTITWYKNEEKITQIQRTAGDETQVNLAIVQASCRDFGVYGCSITNEYGTDSTDVLLSPEIITGMSLREDLGVGEEIEMMPLIFTKGVADPGTWGSKFFGRIILQESHIGEGCSRKVWRAKVIYGLEPVFESGHTCIIKVRNPLAYGGKGESGLIERNLDIIKQECKIQNMAREYLKIFSAEARVIENFGPSLEVIPVYLMYRPANTVPYATVEADLTGVYQKYSVLDSTGRIEVKSGSEMEQKCCALQHWIYQWTSGNLLFTRLEGVDSKITNVGISVKSTGHLSLSVEGTPKVFELFVSQHQCNYFCGLLSLRSLKVVDSLLTPTKPKGSRSPLLQRKSAAGSGSPQMGRKATGSPRLVRKTGEQDVTKTPERPTASEPPTVVKLGTE